MAVIGNAPATTGTTVSAQSFNGDNSTVAFTLTRSVNSTVDLEVLVDNVQQSPYDGSYSVSGTTLTFSAAPATGTNNIYVIYRGATIATAQVIPDDGSVTNAKMASGAALTNVGTGNITADYLNVGQLGGRRNLIINGAMQVAQRGTSATVDGYLIDRWDSNVNDGAWTISQVADGPDGFANSYKLEVTTAVAQASLTGLSEVRTRLEGQDLQLLKKGTASAEQFTLSFWVKSNLTGTYTLFLYDEDNTRMICGTYTVSSSATWEHHSVTFEGDTTGAFDNDANRSFRVCFGFAARNDSQTNPLPTSWTAYDASKRNTGQVNLLETIGNYWQITGVQLEVGSVATPFEHRSYGEELAACQRYFFKSYNDGVAPGTITEVGAYYRTVDAVTPYGSTGPIRYPVTMRTTPTVTFYSPGSGTSGKIQLSGDKTAVLTRSGANGCGVYISNNSSGVGTGSSCQAHLTAEAEL
jgi:hypothetical protein